MNDLYYPLRSLKEGHWFKLICGASYQHLPAVRNLALTYALAGADCIDVAADPAVVSAAKAGLDVADSVAQTVRPRPWLMVSFNDGEDPHFRKAELDPIACPPDCPRPCESICPAQAIVFPSSQPYATHHELAEVSGVLSDHCYGCGRCLPLCPIQQIVTRSYGAGVAAVAPLVLQSGVEAIEIHTQVGRVAEFQRLWEAIAPWTDRLKLVSISCPDGEDLIDYLWALHEVISPLSCALIWQTDGRPMSGDIGAGATRATVKLGQKVLAARLPGFVQLAGGTNHYTVPKLRSLDLLARQGPDQKAHVSGVAYGSYARSLLLPVLNQLEAMATAQQPYLEKFPPLLQRAVELAGSLVSPIKSLKLNHTHPLPVPPVSVNSYLFPAQSS
ncbi:MAG TPA: LdpA C-terminal domain-containing domain [Thermosynechococcaceae cyanobacterium]